MLSRRLSSLLAASLALLSLGAARPASAQVFDLDKDREPMVLLDGLWRFHPGDDPHWADPDFDAKGEQLTLLTDGVVEARDRNGELFGFERTSAVATESAESIAQAAQNFGQEDDITVLTITRLGLGEEAVVQLETLSPSLA
jgi:hypothetical protein